jgi:hypothetical protein
MRREFVVGFVSLVSVTAMSCALYGITRYSSGLPKTLNNRPGPICVVENDDLVTFDVDEDPMLLLVEGRPHLVEAATQSPTRGLPTGHRSCSRPISLRSA